VNPLQRLFVVLIRLYQIALSPYFGQQCRFTPTCSEYTRQAIQRHGAWKGAWLGMKRVSRCHPWHPGGHDPVP
jgi:hypothetical protein